MGLVTRSLSIILEGLGACEGGVKVVTLPWICCARKCMSPSSWVDAATEVSASQGCGERNEGRRNVSGESF